MIENIDIYLRGIHKDFPLNYTKHNVLFFLRKLKIPKLKKLNIYLYKDQAFEIQGESTSVCNIYYNFNPNSLERLYTDLIKTIVAAIEELISLYNIEDNGVILEMKESLSQKEVNFLEIFKKKEINSELSCSVCAEFYDTHNNYYFKLNLAGEFKYVSFFKCHSRCLTSFLIDNFYTQNGKFIVSDKLNQIFFVLNTTDLSSEIFIKPSTHNKEQIQSYLDAFSIDKTTEEYIKGLRKYLNW